MAIPRTARKPVAADGAGSRPLVAARAALVAPALLTALAAQAQPVMPNDPMMGGGGAGFVGMGGAMGLAPGRIAAGPRGPYDWTAGIGSRLTFTDNGTLAPKGQEQADTILEVFPFLSVIAAGPKAQGFLTYSPRLVMRDLDTRTGDGLTHRLETRGNVFLVDESIGVQARATVAQVNTAPLGTSAFDPGLNPNSSSTYKLAEISPYARGGWGGTQYLFRYGLTWIDDGVRSYDVTQHLLSGLLSNLSVRGPIGWRAYAEQRHTSYDSLLSFDRSYATAVGTYTVSRELRLGLGVNYSRSDLLLSDSGADSGWGPTATIEWFPTPRTSAFAAWSGTYFGHIAQARANHRALNWLFGLAYRDTIQDNAAAGLVMVDPALIQTDVTSATQQTPATSQQMQQIQGAAPPGQVLPTPLAYGSLNSAIVHIQSLVATVGYTTPRTTYTANLFLTEQDNRLTLAANLPGGATPQDLSQRGLDGRVAHRLTPRTTVGVLARLQRSSSDIAAASTTLTALQLDVGYLLSPSIIAGAGYRHVRQRGDSGPTFLGYDENAVFITATARF
jgi:uncharacterized protein (PEP-CTERM system associated)